jgi:hypothetical protein
MVGSVISEPPLNQTTFENSDQLEINININQECVFVGENGAAL